MHVEELFVVCCITLNIRCVHGIGTAETEMCVRDPLLYEHHHIFHYMIRLIGLCANRDNTTQLKFVTGWQCLLRVDAWLRLDGAHIQAKTGPGGESIILLLETKVVT